MPLPPKLLGKSDFGDKDLYAVLKISPSAPFAEIPSAYRRAALLAHPDKGGSGEAFQLVTHAFEVLACTGSRKLYDQARGWSTESREVGVVATEPKYNASVGVSATSRGNNVMPKGGDHGTKRSMSEVGPPPKKQRTSKASATIGLTKPGCTRGMRRTPEKLLLTALETLKNVLQAMCVEQRRQAISNIVLRVRIELLTFMEMQKKQAKSSISVHTRESEDKEHRILPIEDVACELGHTDPSCIGKSSHIEESKPIQEKVPSHALLQIGCTHGSSLTHTADTRPFIQTRKFSPAQQKGCSAMTGIQCKKSRYKAHLHIKSFRIYTKSHSTIDMAIDHQIILMQIRLAWTSAWQSNSHLWEDCPEQYACLCEQVLKANGTSQSELGLKAFVSMEARLWLGKNCFVISPVMDLSEALEWQAKLLRARQVSWPVFRAAWVELMQCMRHARAKVRSAEEAQLFADAAYRKHQIFVMQREQKDEAKNLARQKRREQKERQRQVKREKRTQARSARHKAKMHALLSKRLAKAVQRVERALDLRAKRDARLSTDRKARATSE